VLGDSKTLLPDPVATVQATEQLVSEGFQVLVYTTDDPVTALRLKQAGALPSCRRAVPSARAKAS
jgi:thiazole synthase